MPLLPEIGLLILSVATGASLAPVPEGIPCGQRTRCTVVDDFQKYARGGLPLRWSTNQDRGQIVPVDQAAESPDERFVVMQEGQNRFVRATVKDQAHRLILQVGDDFPWSVDELPVLSWRWRAVRLPEGAREDRRNRNDTGAAVYVVFDNDFLGRPRSIKYSYSSTLPPGTVVTYGPLKVVVVASGETDGTGTWMSMERNVAADYQWLFGRPAPDSPTALILWSDSDTMDTVSEADFDDIALSSAG